MATRANGKGMRVAVLGAGMQGVCTALELADRGVNVDLIERADDLMTGAATANEGKIHLGYVYGADRSLDTARRMIEGAMVFAPLVRRWIGSALDDVPRSSEFIYAVHRDSQLSSEDVECHLGLCAELVDEASARPGSDYFGQTLARPTALRASEREAAFDSELIVAAFRTGELAVDPVGLAEVLKARVRSEPRIEVRTGCRVVRLLTEAGVPAVVTDGAEGTITSRYDHVVNALWDSRIAMDATRGEVPTRPWLHRFKYGLRIPSSTATAEVPTMVVVQGPFGDVVRYSNGALYLSWYPACCVGSSADLLPPDWTNDGNTDLAKIAGDTLTAFSTLLTALPDFKLENLAEGALRGGSITAWGDTDIDDPSSELHNRYDIGVHSTGRHHSIDTGKYTMAPLFAQLCADRIVPAPQGS